MQHPQAKTIVHRNPAPVLSAEDDAALINQLYQLRDFEPETAADRSLARLPDPWLLSGMDQMVHHLQKVLTQQQSLLVLADFDADGATSCALAVLGLRALGGVNIGYLVPNRFDYGYGMTEEIVSLAAQRNPDWILTVDNGITSIAGARAAAQAGIGVLITDHHLPGAELPEAAAVVNPNLPEDPFPGKAIAGVGVMFFVLLALRQTLRNSGWFTEQRIEPNLAELLDLVALGTVADVVPLDQINRILVYQGLQRIRAGRMRPGIKALLDVAKRSARDLDAQGLGFTLAPRLNAAGRMQDMSVGIECLLTDDTLMASTLAERLDSMNRDRREVEETMKQEALQLLANTPTETLGADAGLCLYNPNWHQGVIGILASRIKDRMLRPVIVFADSANDQLKGSARSVPDVHIRDTLSDIASRHPDLMLAYGGHAMAAGITLKKNHLAHFQTAFCEAVKHRTEHLQINQTLLVDGELAPEHLTLKHAEAIRDAGPWGQHFPVPQFDGCFTVIENRIVGEKHLKMSLGTHRNSKRFDAIVFFVDNPAQWLGCKAIRAVYRLEINQFAGTKRLQLGIDYMEALSH